MSIVLDGTAGITTPEITSAGGPLVVNASAPDNSVVVASSGNVGIGVAAPGVKLVTASSATDSKIEIQNTSTAASLSKTSALQFTGTDTVGTIKESGDIYVSPADNNYVSSAMRFFTRVSDAVDERMRITSSGNLLVGATSQLDGGSYGRHEIHASIAAGGAASLVVYNSNSSDSSPALNSIKNSSTTTASARFMQFYAGAGVTPMGGIVGNGASNVQFASLSDAREKTNITPINGSLEKVVALKPVAFDWIANGEHCPAGFVAQDVEQVFPEFVVENMSSEGAEVRKGLTGGMTGGIVAHLVAAIKELKAINDAQAQTIESLTARVVALEGQA